MTFIEDFKKAEHEAYSHLDESNCDYSVRSGDEFRFGVKTLLDGLESVKGDYASILDVMRTANEFLEWKG